MPPEGLIEKLKRWFGPSPAGGAAKAETASAAEVETPTNARPEGATDEPWSGAGGDAGT